MLPRSGGSGRALALCSPFDGRRIPWPSQLVGSARYSELVAAEHRRLDRLLARDPLRLRRLVPRRARQGLYPPAGRGAGPADPRAREITAADFELGDAGLDACLDVVAVGVRAP